MTQETKEAKKNECKRCPAERCFNIIDSVKGGSGKTSLSLMLSLAAQRYMQEQESAQGQKKEPSLGKGRDQRKQLDQKHVNYSLLMDMDMQGSALDYLLFENSDVGRAAYTLNDAILKYYTKETPKFISRPKIYFSNDIGGVTTSEEDATAEDGNQQLCYEIAVALASRKVSDRDRFRAVSRMNYSSQITYETFRSGLKTVLKDSNLSSYLPTPPQYVFFDMPPNSNGYSDCVLELLLTSWNDPEAAIAPRYPRNYFELMTLDRGHIMATLDWFEEFINQEQYQFPDHFFFVFNNIPKNISSMEYTYPIQKSSEGCLRAAVNTVRERLNSSPRLTEEQRSRIRLVGIAYQEDYLHRCCSAGTLAISNPHGLNQELLFPVNFIQGVMEEQHDDSFCTDELLELMCTKA